MRLLAIDPGKTSGWAWYRTGDPRSFNSGEFPMLECLDYVDSLIRRALVDVVVCENYIITASTLRKTRGENWSLESIGVLRWLCSRASIRFLLQTPAEGKGFGTDTKLKSLDWYRPTLGGHSNDAARHALTFLAKEGQLPVGL